MTQCMLRQPNVARSALVVLSVSATLLARPARADTGGHAVYLPFTVRDYVTAGTVTFAVIGSYGACSGGDKQACAAEHAVARLVRSWRPDFVITTGGNTDPNGPGGSYDADVRAAYGTYLDGRFFPTMGPEDWVKVEGKPSADAYLKAFPWLAEHTRSLIDPTAPPNGSQGRYYHFQAGSHVMSTGRSCPLVDLFALDSTLAEPDGTLSSGASRQGNWQAAEILGSRACFQVAYFHHPPFSSGGRLGSDEDRAAMRAMRDWDWHTLHVPFVFAGRSRNDEALFLNRGPYLLVNGLGGQGQDPWAWIDPFSRSRFPAAPDGQTYGATLVHAFTGEHGTVGLAAQPWFIDVNHPDAPAQSGFGASNSTTCGCVPPATPTAMTSRRP